MSHLGAPDTNEIRFIKGIKGINFLFHIKVRNKVPMEIRCKGVPKFNCTFLFDTDEYCDQVPIQILSPFSALIIDLRIVITITNSFI